MPLTEIVKFRRREKGERKNQSRFEDVLWDHKETLKMIYARSFVTQTPCAE